MLDCIIRRSLELERRAVYGESARSATKVLEEGVRARPRAVREVCATVLPDRSGALVMDLMLETGEKLR